MQMIVRVMFILSCSLLFGLAAFADNAKIQGKVKEEGGKGLRGVTVKATRSVTRS